MSEAQTYPEIWRADKPKLKPSLEVDDFWSSLAKFKMAIGCKLSGKQGSNFSYKLFP